MPLNGRLYQNLMSLRPGIVTQPGELSLDPEHQQQPGRMKPSGCWTALSISISMQHLALAGHTSPFTDGATIMPIDAIQEFNME